MKRRGQHRPQPEQAVQEQKQADQILQTVERVEHYNYLRDKYGQRTHDKTKCPSADGPCPGCRP